MKSSVTRQIRVFVLISALLTLLCGTLAVGQTLEDKRASYREERAQCERHKEDLKREEERLRTVESSPDIGNEKRELAHKAAEALKGEIKVADRLLNAATNETDPRKQSEQIARANLELVSGFNMASIAGDKLGISATEPAGRVIGANSSKLSVEALNAQFDGLYTRTARFDNPDPKSWGDGDRGFRAVGTGTDFFGASANSSAQSQIKAIYAETQPNEAIADAKLYGSNGGGVLLEGVATLVPPISQISYDGRHNALVIDAKRVYFLKALQPFDIAALCRAIHADKQMRVGVSMSGNGAGLIYGVKSAYERTGLTRNLLVTDAFLGEMVFASNGEKDKWHHLYKLPSGYKLTHIDISEEMLVQFLFRVSEFSSTANGELIGRPNFIVRLMPLSENHAEDGGGLADTSKLSNHWKPPDAILHNATGLQTHFVAHFSKEKTVAQTIAFAELAALFRSYKLRGGNLRALASSLERD